MLNVNENQNLFSRSAVSIEGGYFITIVSLSIWEFKVSFYCWIGGVNHSILRDDNLNV